MKTLAVRCGALTVGLMFGLGACLPSGPQPRPAASGSAATSGTGGPPSPPANDAGPAEDPSGINFSTGSGDADGGAGSRPSGAGGRPGAAGSPASSCSAAGQGGTAGTPGRGGVSPQLPATISHAETPVPPLSGGTLLALADGTTVVASDPDRDRVYVVDLSSNAVRSTIVLQAGDEPGRAAQDGAGQVHVVLRRGGGVATVDPVMGTLTARRNICSAPRGIAYQSATNQLHVACAGGELVSLPADGGAATRTLTLERDLRDVVVGASGSLLVSTFRKAEVLVVAADGSVTKSLQPGSGMAMAAGTMTPQHRTPSVAWRMLSLGDGTGKVLMLHQTGVDDAINTTAGGYAGIRGCAAIVQSGLSVLSQDQVAPPALAPGLSLVTFAIDAAISPDQQSVAVAVPGNSDMSTGLPTLVEGPISTITQTNTGCIVIGSVPGVPSAPAQAGAPALEAQFVAVAYTNTGVLLGQTREPATLWRKDTGTTITLATDSRADTGHLLFHGNAGGGLACASCHPEGGEDGRVWTFACLGARRTQSIRGGITATAPFHWDGTESDFSRLMDDVFSTRMAGPMLSGDQKTALQSWIDTIPALPKASAPDSVRAAAVSRGQTLFNDPKLACATCHTGALLTNNLTVDVGTGGAFQVPSLRGVVWRAPFMHSGCAATLADRFGGASCGGGDQHGATSTLMPSQLSDLTAYLESL